MPRLKKGQKLQPLNLPPLSAAQKRNLAQNKQTDNENTQKKENEKEEQKPESSSDGKKTPSKSSSTNKNNRSNTSNSESFPSPPALQGLSSVLSQPSKATASESITLEDGTVLVPLTSFDDPAPVEKEKTIRLAEEFEREWQAKRDAGIVDEEEKLISTAGARRRQEIVADCQTVASLYFFLLV